MHEPALKANELLDRLGELHHLPQLNQLELMRIEREANQLLKSDPASAHMLLGIIGCIKKDLESSRYHHELSIKLSSHYLMRENYALSLGELNQWRLSLEQYDILLDVIPSLQGLRTALSYAVRSAQPEKALQYYKKLTKLQPELSDDEGLVRQMKIVNTLQQIGLSDEVLLEIHELVQGVVDEFATNITSQHVWTDHWSGNQPRFINDLYVTHSNVVDMEWRLAEVFAEANLPALCEGRYAVHFQTGVVAE